VTVPRTPARTTGALGVLVGIGLVTALAGCTGPARPAEETSAGSSPAPSSTSVATLMDPGSLRVDGAAVTSGEVTLAVWPPVGLAASAPDEDGAVVLQVPLPQVADGTTAVLPVATLVAPEGMTLDALSDDSTVVRGADGGVVAALTAPVLTGEAAAAGLRVTVTGADDGTIAWSVTRPVRTDGSVETDPSPAGTATATFAATAVRSATWADRDDEGGQSLAVVPATWARSGSLAAEEAVWAQVVSIAPDADLPTMRDQLTCHTIGAPDKASWNLEPWRPEVGLLATLAARCNPA
jgi:hypothetical protein